MLHERPGSLEFFLLTCVLSSERSGSLALPLDGNVGGMKQVDPAMSTVRRSREMRVTLTCRTLASAEIPIIKGIMLCCRLTAVRQTRQVDILLKFSFRIRPSSVAESRKLLLPLAREWENCNRNPTCNYPMTRNDDNNNCIGVGCDNACFVQIQRTSVWRCRIDASPWSPTNQSFSKCYSGGRICDL